MILVALDEVKDFVPDVEGPTPHSSAVVPSQHLLVLGLEEEGNITSFVQLVHGILVGCLGSLFVVRPNPWHSIVKVSWEDGLGTIDHEEGRVAGGSTRGCPQALEYRRKFSDPARAEFVQLVEDSRLEAL